MMRATDYFLAASFAAISAAIALPCQAQTVVETVVDLTRNVTETNQTIDQTEYQDINNNSAGDRAKNINNSTKSFTISETTSLPANSSSVTSPKERQSLRSNPLGCRFFYTPSMQQ